jgi:hypothetical protein
MATNGNRPPKEVWEPYLEKALAYKSENGNLRDFPRLLFANDNWYVDNKGNGNYSAKSLTAKNLEKSNRRAKGSTFTRKDYHDFAKKYGFTAKEADTHFDKLQSKLKGLAKRKSLKFNSDHINAIHLDEGWEHWRNQVLMDSKNNGFKGNKPISREESLRLGIGQTKEELLGADFLDVPRANGREVRASLYNQGLMKPESNGTASTGVTSSELKTNGNGNGNGNGASNGHNGNGASNGHNGNGASNGYNGNGAANGIDDVASAASSMKNGTKLVVDESRNVLKVASKTDFDTALKLLKALF